MGLGSNILGAVSSVSGGRFFSLTFSTGPGVRYQVNTGQRLIEGGALINKLISAGFHTLYDTVRGGTKQTDLSAATAQGTIQSPGYDFNAGGFSSPGGTGTWAHFTFKTTNKVFTVLDYEGTGTSSRAVPHGLGAAPEFMIIIAQNISGARIVYHVDLGAGDILVLNNSLGRQTFSQYFSNQAPSASAFTVGWNGISGLNAPGVTYTAYLFAGKSGALHVGDYAGTGANGNAITSPGFRPAAVIIKGIDASSDWLLVYERDGSVYYTSFNTTSPSVDISSTFTFTDNGFTVDGIANNLNANSQGYVYVAFAGLAAQELATDVQEDGNVLLEDGNTITE